MSELSRHEVANGDMSRDGSCLVAHSDLITELTLREQNGMPMLYAEASPARISVGEIHRGPTASG
jgi:hypothetical protein